MAAVTIGNLLSMSWVVPVSLASAVCFASRAMVASSPCPWCHQEWPVSPAVSRGLAATLGVVSLLLVFSFALVGKEML